MSDIIENEEVDKDTINKDTLDKQFNKHYKLLVEQAVSLKKSYINKLHGNKSINLAVSLSDNSIEVYKLTNASLSSICKLSGHSKTLTEVVFSPLDDHMLYSTAEDGVIKLWDTRSSGSCVQEYKDKEDSQIRPYDCMDVSCNDRILCAGSQLVQDDVYLVFWDQRNTKPLGGYWNSHTDDITQVKFHKDRCEVLATGSMDGLLNIFNIMEQSEDDALIYSLNIENSVEKLSWLDSERVACITQSNDLQIWDHKSGNLVKKTDRDKISRGIKRSKGDDCYLVDTYNSIDDAAVLLAGSYGGNGDCLRSVVLAEKKLQPCTNFSENKQTVCCCWYHKETDLLVTAGEAGIISVWTAGEAPPNGSASKLTKPLNKLSVNRHKPY